jgi:hypothetical protein
VNGTDIIIIIIITIIVFNSSPDEAIEFFSIYLILLAAPWPWGLLGL